MCQNNEENNQKKVKKKIKKKIPVFWKSVIIIAVVISFILGLSIMFQEFAQWYRRGIFRGTQYVMAHISGIFPVSVGEIMIYIGILMVFFLIVSIFIGFFPKPLCKKIRKYYVRVMICVGLYVYATETLNCFVIYRGESIEDELVSQGAAQENITNESLIALHHKVVEQLNKLSTEFTRDEEGYIIMTEAQKNEYQKKCQEALHNISEEFPLLKGYYPKVKEIQASDFMTQQYLLGIYFPFSMEANYNGRAYVTNLPVTYCHELSHLKGYIMEDEANFLAYVACIRSDDIFMQYCGYLSVLSYIQRDLISNLSNDELNEIEWENDLVARDNTFVKEGVMEQIEEEALISTEVISEATDTFLDTNLKVNGVSDGIVSYSRVVKLILLYEQIN